MCGGGGGGGGGGGAGAGGRGGGGGFDLANDGGTHDYDVTTMTS